MNRPVREHLGKNSADERRLKQESKILRFLFKWIRPIRPGDLASRLNMKHQTVNSILKKFVESHLLEWEPYKNVELTEQGRLVAAHYDHHHNLLEHYLKDTLDLSDAQAHKESLRIAPLVSCRMISAICRKYDIQGEEGCVEQGMYPDLSHFCVESTKFKETGRR